MSTLDLDILPTLAPVGAGAQRRPDRGDGSFVNPILPGDHPDPRLLKEGGDYYLSCASQQFFPGAGLWHSRDLVNWSPLGAALRRPLGTVGAPDLARHAGRYFLYLTVLLAQRRTSIFVLHADDMRGPWSEPIDLGLVDCLDPCHVVAEDGSRHLLVNGVRRIRLSDDGLATVGGPVHVHTPALPQPAAQPAFASAGPRVFRRGGQFYLVCAAGGAGDPSGPHVLAVARSPSLDGPWQDCPFNPLDGGAAQAWTTGGSASLVQGHEGDWWLVCHGREAGYPTLGRQVLLQPVEWGRDGWFRCSGRTLDRPLRKPRRAQPCAELPALSDDFRADRLGLQWSFFDAGADEAGRLRHDSQGLLLSGKGSGLADCSPLTCTVADHSYEADLEFELLGAAQGGLALFHDAHGFVGIGIAAGRMHTYSYGQEHRWMQQVVHGHLHRLRLTQHHHRISFQHAAGDGPWTPNPWLNNVSALHQNRLGSLHGLRLALFCAGDGDVRMKRFSYRQLDA